MIYDSRISGRVRKDLSLNNGQSVIEVIVAIAIFVIIAGSSVITILGSLSASRLAEEETQATFIATEGIEAVQSIRNQSWSNLVDGTYGLQLSSGFWEFAGVDDTTGKFTRFVSVSSVERLNDDIVTSGGTTDDDTKLITSSVTWDFTSARTNTVETSQYMTNWQEGVGTSSGDPPVSTCNDYCISLGTYSSGTCRKNAGACGSAGETNEPTGDQYCTGGPQVDTCCCLP